VEPERASEVLIVHDGELADVSALLDAQGARWRELRGGQADDTARLSGSHRVLIATARRMLALQSAPGERPDPRPVAIAVLDSDSRTLRARLRRMDVDFLVRRPVHPAALRLLLTDALYAGPERRREPRRSVGVPVRYRTGLWRRRALLTDLSLHGCGLLTPRPLRDGARIALHLPPALGVGRTLVLRGRVVRIGPAPLPAEGGHAAAVRFGALSAAARDRLRSAVVIHACGPARLPEVPRPPLVGASEAADEERRAGPRREFRRHVIAHAAAGSGVLLGRDLSRGGMRIARGPRLALGAALRLAIPLAPGEGPLVVDATVARDDGERGLVLRFGALAADGEARLKRALGYLPICRSQSDPDADYAGLVVSEILEIGDAARIPDATP
jgi:hypothetical protein